MTIFKVYLIVEADDVEVERKELAMFEGNLNIQQLIIDKLLDMVSFNYPELDALRDILERLGTIPLVDFLVNFNTPDIIAMLEGLTPEIKIAICQSICQG